MKSPMLHWRPEDRILRVEFFHACQEGDLEAIKTMAARRPDLLLDTCVDLEEFDCDGCSGIAAAALCGKIEAAQWMSERIDAPWWAWKDNALTPSTLIEHALREADFHALEWMIELDKADGSHARMEPAARAIEELAQLGEFESINPMIWGFESCLSEHPEDMSHALTPILGIGALPCVLFQAAAENCPAVLASLLSMGSDPKAELPHGRTPLEEAASHPELGWAHALMLAAAERREISRDSCKAPAKPGRTL